jgi:Tol biopolymer transport system component
MNADGSNPMQITKNVGTENFYPTWANDSGNISFFSSQPFSEISSISVVNPDGSNLIKVIEGKGVRPDYVWSKDNDKIVFILATDYTQINIIDIDGSNQKNITNDKVSHYGLCWVQ